MSELMTETIRLPWPPTVNNIRIPVVIKGKARLILSPNGRKYFKEVLKLMSIHKWKKFGSRRLKVEIHCFAGDRRIRDLGNLDKVLIDSLKKAGVYDDDSQIDHQTYIRGENCKAKNGNVVVYIEEIIKEGWKPVCSCEECCQLFRGGPLFKE